MSWPGIGRHGTGGPGPIGVVFQGPQPAARPGRDRKRCLPLLLADCAEARGDRPAPGARWTGWGSPSWRTSCPRNCPAGRPSGSRSPGCWPPRRALILADEPTGQLDQHTAALVIDVLVQAADELGAALIVATHDPVIARRLPTEWAMHDGRLRSAARADGGEVPR